MIEATNKNCTAAGRDRFTADASDLQIPDGEWPARIPTTLGNVLDFALVRYVPGDGAIYRQDCGCVELRVYNA